jgi:hypothetical protein
MCFILHEVHRRARSGAAPPDVAENGGKFNLLPRAAGPAAARGKSSDSARSCKPKIEAGEPVG